MKILLSYIFISIPIAIIGIVYYFGGFWAACTFLLLGLIVLMGLLSTDYLKFSTPKPRWICGTPQAVQEEVDEHYQKAVELVKEHKGATVELLQDNLGLWGNGGTEEKIISRIVEEGILTETTTRTWVLKDSEKAS